MKGNQTRRLRILLLEDNSLIRSMLCKLLLDRGWEVFSYPEPDVCPLRALAGCTCKQAEVCADALVTDLEMPHINGLTFARELLQKGCRIPNLAMVTGSQDTALIAEARAIGLAVFQKPDGITALLDWLDNVEANLMSERQLVHWSEV